MSPDPAAPPRPARTRSVGWWARSVALVAVPAALGLLAATHDNAGTGLVLGILAFIGAIFVFHPDTLGWKLSLTGRMVDGEDPGPSHLWQVWARMSGLFCWRSARASIA